MISSTTKQADQMTPSELRSVRKAARFAREAKRLAKFGKASPAATAELTAIRKDIITFEDLDDSQLYVYRGIHTWWEEQQRRITLFDICGSLVVAGYSGTGKSSLLGVALPALRNADGSNVRVKYCAYTGKAANVLMGKGLNAQTIHSLIYDCIPDPGDISQLIFILKDAEDIEAELIVVDEASMVPDDMREELESLGIPILYTGDHGQLPPVTGRGNVMEDPTYKLEDVHRQALDSGIIKIATDVRRGVRVPNGTYGVTGDAQKVGSDAIKDTALLAGADMVICFSNRRRAELNTRLRKYKGFVGKYPLVGEKLICVKNNKNTSMFNGLVLTIDAIRMEGGYLVFDGTDDVGNAFYGLKAFTNYFDGDEHPKLYGKTFFDVFEFAYAITGHKSQGSQWENVIVVEEVMRGQRMDLKKRWMYTVLTRAIKKLTWISRFK